ncbi:MAG: serine acetyltransferase [Syntrophomonadaceae bacterium]|nr:serine acetyltransferase [Syntrophomonadaceae bacterium]
MSKYFQEKVSSLVSSYVDSYKKHSRSINRDQGSLPNRDVIKELINMLREILFPEYFGRQQKINAAIDYHIGDLLLNIHEKLSQQISYALKHEALRKKEEIEDYSEKAEAISYAFLAKIPEIRDALACDVQAALNGDPAAASKDEIIISYPGIFAISVYRLAHELYQLEVPLIPRIMTEYAHSRTGIDINPGATIGKYFFIDHGTGVVIGETTSIGDNVTLYQGVTLGALSTREGQLLRGVKRHPTIEDNVVVYSGASILGGETVIGQGTVIGSNVFITKSVPSGTRVIIKNQELVYKGQGQVYQEGSF